MVGNQKGDVFFQILKDNVIWLPTIANVRFLAANIISVIYIIHPLHKTNDTKRAFTHHTPPPHILWNLKKK
jgi:hypothetical protein